MEVSLGRKINFFAKKSVFWLGPVLGGLPVPGKILMHFRPGGQKSLKNGKIMKKSKIFDFSKSIQSENLDIWRPVLTKKMTFLRNFTFFFWLGPVLGPPSTGENTYAFSAGKPKTGRYLFAEPRFPWACLREPLLSEQISSSFWFPGRKCISLFPSTGSPPSTGPSQKKTKILQKSYFFRQN